jgi:uncharacterized protein
VQLIENTDSVALLITAINEKSIVINKYEYEKSCIVSNKALVTDLNLTAISDLNSQHIELLLSTKPELIIIGSGNQHVFPDVNLLTPIAKLNIGFEVMNNKSASRTYNVLVAEERKVACLLII